MPKQLTAKKAAEIAASIPVIFRDCHDNGGSARCADGSHCSCPWEDTKARQKKIAAALRAYEKRP